MKLIQAIFFLIIFFGFGTALKAQEPSPVLRDISQKLSLLESKVNRLNATQDQIVQKNQEINQELHSLQIWIRRNRGGK